MPPEVLRSSRKSLAVSYLRATATSLAVLLDVVDVVVVAVVAVVEVVAGLLALFAKLS